MLDTAEKLCDKIAIIKNGRIVESGRLEDLTRGESLEDTFMETVEKTAVQQINRLVKLEFSNFIGI